MKPSMLRRLSSKKRDLSGKAKAATINCAAHDVEVDIVSLDMEDAATQKAYQAYIILNSKPGVIIFFMELAIPLYLAAMLGVAYYFEARSSYFVSVTDSIVYSVSEQQ